MSIRGAQLNDGLLRGVRDGAVRLATISALASRIEPQLLRGLRLQIEPSLDAGAESELWFSRLVSFRAPTGLVLSQHVLPTLRNRLAADREKLDAAWSVTASAHASASPAIRAEEELTYLALKGIDDKVSEERVRELLRQLVRTLVERRSSGLAEWVNRALPRLPRSLVSLEEVRMLAYAAARRLGRISPIASLGRELFTEAEGWAWLSTENAQHLQMSVRLVEGGVEFGPRGLELSHPIDVPALTPLSVRIWSTDLEGMPGSDFQLSSSGRSFCPIDSDTVEIQILDGDRISLRRPGQSKSIAERLNAPRTVITYQNDPDAGTYIELPFVVGVMGDFSGASPAFAVALGDRRFRDIDIDNFDAVMASFRPAVSFEIPHMDSEAAIRVELEFSSMSMFSPKAISNSVEPIRTRVELRNSVAGLRDRLSDPERLSRIQGQLRDAELLALAAEIQALIRNGREAINRDQSGADTISDAASFSLTSLLTLLQPMEGAQAILVAERLVEASAQGAIETPQDIMRIFDEYLAALDGQVNALLNGIFHHPEFKRLEGSWRGLHYLVNNSETGALLKIRVLQLAKNELQADMAADVDPTTSSVASILYKAELDTLGGEPYGVLIGDYYWGNEPDDVEALTSFSSICGLCCAPLISGVSASMFGVEAFEELSSALNLGRLFEGPEYANWRKYRDTDNSGWVSLTLPRTLARLPYGAAGIPTDGLYYEEVETSISQSEIVSPSLYCWMNTAYVFGAQMTTAFARTGLCIAIRGAENGGRVSGLPVHTFPTDDLSFDSMCPTEIGITDRLDFELESLGFLPLCHYKQTDYAVFMGAGTTQKPKKYDRASATANAHIAARLPYRMVVGRFAHYLMCMMRDKTGAHVGADGTLILNRWIQEYVNANDHASMESRARFPLREGRIEFEETPGRPGSSSLVVYLRPWLNIEELTSSLRTNIRAPSWWG